MAATYIEKQAQGFCKLTSRGMSSLLGFPGGIFALILLNIVEISGKKYCGFRRSPDGV